MVSEPQWWEKTLIPTVLGAILGLFLLLFTFYSLQDTRDDAQEEHIRHLCEDVGRNMKRTGVPPRSCPALPELPGQLEIDVY